MNIRNKIEAFTFFVSVTLPTSVFAGSDWADKPVEKVNDLKDGLEKIGDAILIVSFIWGVIALLLSRQKDYMKVGFTVVGGFLLKFGPDLIAAFLS